MSLLRTNTMTQLKPHAILFDMDGVLVDTESLWFTAFNASLKQYNYPLVTKQQFSELFWGKDLSDSIESINVSKDVLPACNEYYLKHLHKVRLFPTALTVLSELNTYKKAIITNTPKTITMQIVETLHLTHYFDTIVTVDDVAKGKPAPDVVYEACKQLSVIPSDTVLIGDTINDVTAGKTAGCTVIGLNVKADFTIQSLHELSSILKIESKGETRV